MKVRDIALTRSGDKGNLATLSVIVLDPARFPDHYAMLEAALTESLVRQFYAGVVLGRVQRYELPELHALHFVMHDALGGGVTRSLALDAHGKSLSSALLDMNICAGLAQSGS